MASSRGGRHTVSNERLLTSQFWSVLRKVNVFLLLALLLAAIAHFRWISFAVFQYGDWRFHFAEVGKTFLDLSPWDTNFSLGQVSSALWKLPFNLLYGLFGSSGFDSNITEKFLVFWPAILLPPMSARSRWARRSKWARMRLST